MTLRALLRTPGHLAAAMRRGLMFAERFVVMIKHVCSGPRYLGTELGRRKAKGKRDSCTETSSLRNAVAVTSFSPPSQKRILEVNHTLGCPEVSTTTPQATYVKLLLLSHARERTSLVMGTPLLPLFALSLLHHV
jgi:hypothetical protein